MESVAPGKITYRDLVEADLPILHEWLSRPHVAEWQDAQGAILGARGRVITLYSVATGSEVRTTW